MAGYTERVDTLITVLEDCAKCKYKRKIASEAMMLNSKVGEKTSRRKRTETEEDSNRRQCLEFDRNGSPLIQGLVTESTDGSILLENVSFNTRTTWILLRVTF